MRASGLIVGLIALAGLSGCAATGGNRADDGRQVLINRDKNGLAIEGYDPVAYFTEKKPVVGDARFRSSFGGATYQFASSAHKQAFDAEPAKYAPQFGGYCAYAASINKISPISPQFWEIVDGRLILQHNQKAWDAWHEDAAGNLKKADANWPGLESRFAKPAKTLVNIDKDGIALQHYDAVSYFEGKPQVGKSEFESVFGGAKYHFATKEHREEFEKDPAKYEPQFGGYCGYAASINKISPVNPLIYQIIDGRLVLQHTREAYTLFNKDPNASLKRADTNWPGLVERKGK